MLDWKLKIEVKACDFESLKRAALETLNGIVRADSVQKMGQSSGLAANNGPVHTISVELSTPVEVRIKRLREEADELERSLQTTSVS